MSTFILLFNDFCFNGLFLGGFIAGEVFIGLILYIWFLLSGAF